MTEICIPSVFRDEENIIDVFSDLSTHFESEYPGELSVTDTDCPATRIRNLILLDALKGGASDIYFERGSHGTRLRYKLDGMLCERPPIPSQLYNNLGNSIKKLFGLIREQEEPISWWQKFRGVQPEAKIVPSREISGGEVFSKSINLKSNELNLNLSLLPINGSTNYHIEIFNPESLDFELDGGLEELIKKQGLVILSGQSDSGRTTTGYKIMNTLADDKNITAILESKQGYNTDYTNRILINPKSNDYERKLLAVRRYNPNVLFFDDVSDRRTAEEALFHSSNGAFVLMAVTERDAERSLVYLRRLGIDNTRLKANLLATVSQKLVALTHEKCGGKGCEDCGIRGYKGMKAEYRISNKK